MVSLLWTMRLNRQGDKTCYSETRCSFARHFAILSRNVGILIGSLLRAKLRAQISTWCLVVFVCSGGSKSGMFQVLLQYFEDRYASFYVQKPNNRFHGITRASKESGSCSQRYPRRPNQDLVQGCTVGNFPKHRFTWTAALARNFPKRISLWFWLLQVSAPESQGKWRTISSEKFSKLTATTTRNWAHETERREIETRTENTFHNIRWLSWIRAG